MITLRLATAAPHLLAGQQCAGLGGSIVDTSSQFIGGELHILEVVVGAMSTRSLPAALRWKLGAQSSRDKACSTRGFWKCAKRGFSLTSRRRSRRTLEFGQPMSGRASRFAHP
eukprot:9180332-Pyramimonas_sp.AAC.1